jgi:hypothetical protein
VCVCVCVFASVFVFVCARQVWDHSKAAEGLWASIEPPADINEIEIFPQSGLMIMATEQVLALACATSLVIVC